MQPKTTSILTHYIDFLHQSRGQSFSNYAALHQWSVDNQSDFWESIAQFFSVDFDVPYQEVFEPSDRFWKAKWFTNSKLSYAHHIFRNANNERPALVGQDLAGKYQEISWNQLIAKTCAFQQRLIDAGVEEGDYVVCYGINSPETIAAFLATNALGAVWSSCSPDFGTFAVCERFAQLQPKVLFAHEHYTYGGKAFDTTKKIVEIQRKISSIGTIISLNEHARFDDAFTSKDQIHFVSVPFSAPIWVLFSSGTTGKPKAIVHGTGHMVLEHFKALALHQDVSQGDRYFWYSTTGWMMWNYALSSLLCGATLCLYSESPTYPTFDTLWHFAKQANINHFGAGAVYFQSQMNQTSLFLKGADFSFLKTIGSTGSPLSAEVCFQLQQQFPHTQVISLSGGTDVCTAFVGGHPDLPVTPGKIQCKMLGAAVDVWNDKGQSVLNTPGELVLTSPFLSMPIYLLGDTSFDRYQSSYFETYKSVWNHGDWAMQTTNGELVIFGRSDATLNRQGVRIGTAEVYDALIQLSNIEDSLLIHLLGRDIDKLILFVQTTSDIDKNNIKTHIRTYCSPRHVPDAIFEIPEVPYTISGKKVEIPVKKLLLGEKLEDVISLDALRNPEAIKWFETFSMFK